MKKIPKQCVACACLFIDRSRGHCYMFDRAPTEICMRRRTRMGGPLEPFTDGHLMPSRLSRFWSWLFPIHTHCSVCKKELSEGNRKGVCGECDAW
jgi:hypothetical protein